MVTTRRTSARKSQTSSPLPAGRKSRTSKTQLHNLVERDDTPDIPPISIDGIVATPATGRTVQDHLAELSSLRTPTTEPRPDHSDLNPKTIHQTTANAPDSGLKLGFADLFTALPNHAATPTRSASRQNLVPSLMAEFEFKFNSEAQLSIQAQRMKNEIRAETAQIRAQMQAERAKQPEIDGEGNKSLDGSRKIASAKGKAGRFSDVHLAQFKKMDSIQNHPSAFRGRPSFDRATPRPLKRTSSRADLDGHECSNSTRMRNTQKHVPPPVARHATSVSPFKSIPHLYEDGSRSVSIRKRQKRSVDDVLSSPAQSLVDKQSASSLYSPTKSSLARSTRSTHPTSSSHTHKLASSSKSLGTVLPSDNNLAQTAVPPIRTSRVPQFHATGQWKQSQKSQSKPHPAETTRGTTKMLKATKGSTSVSKLPAFSALRSILRGKDHKSKDKPSTTFHSDSGEDWRNIDFVKKVDFTPSVKSRHAVKLAADSPSPAKLRQDTPCKSMICFDDHVGSEHFLGEETDTGSEDEVDRVAYPILPDVSASSGPVVHTIAEKARQQDHRESAEFKSIFTTLHPGEQDASMLTAVNTALNKTDPTSHAKRVMQSASNSPAKRWTSTIRPVRPSGVSEHMQPFENPIRSVPHGLPGKKRRRSSITADAMTRSDDNDDTKENRGVPAVPRIPGGWEEGDRNDGETKDDVSTQPASKRARTNMMEIDARVKNVEPATTRSLGQKSHTARESAAKHAKERKSRGVLNLSRLNVLSRPKRRD